MRASNRRVLDASARIDSPKDRKAKLQCQTILKCDSPEVTIENRGAYARVVLSASSKIGRGMTRTLKGELVSNGTDNQRHWDLTINAKDLRDVALATTTTYTVLGIIDQGLLVQPEGSENECKTILLGRERQ
jgi:hypothetical protein